MSDVVRFTNTTDLVVRIGITDRGFCDVSDNVPTVDVKPGATAVMDVERGQLYGDEWLYVGP